MAIQHSVIADANRHEAKGASTASAGYVLKANGDTTTSFVAPNTLDNITLSSTLELSSVTTQNPSAVDTPLQINFGAGGANSDVSVAAGGTITILTTGVYFITINMAFGRANNTGISTMFARLLVNDVAVGFTQSVKIDTSINIVPFHGSILRKLNLNDTIKVQILRDSVGANDGGLTTSNPVLAGWNDSPSAALRVQKITGAS